MKELPQSGMPVSDLFIDALKKTSMKLKWKLKINQELNLKRKNFLKVECQCLTLLFIASNIL
jgi:hypothetical protein